jgi:hypothetical protein
MLATQGVALGYDWSRLQRSGIESMLATQGVALGLHPEGVRCL